MTVMSIYVRRRLIFVLVFYQLASTCKEEELATIQPPDSIELSAILTLEAHLPCDITPTNENDKAHLIFWYRDMSGSPFYSLDVRNKSLTSAQHVTAADFKQRVAFHTDQNPAYLSVQDVRIADEGLYRCRVDFKSSPTRYFSVSVTVIVPPSPPLIFDRQGIKMGTLTEPYNEGSSLFLSCQTREGRPIPSLSWWREDLLVDDSYEVTSSGVVSNDLIVAELSRKDFQATYTCQATNNNISLPQFTSITVDMNLKPLHVKIKEQRRPLSAGRRYKLKCRSFGSRPPPTIAWWMGDRRLKTAQETSSPDGNITTSILTLEPVNSDNRKHLSCRAENPTMLNSGIEDGWTLDIYFSPVATLELGVSLKNKIIREKDDVYFECHVSANPFAHSVKWKFESRYLVTNSTSGIVVSKQSLVIQSVKRENVGSYTCIAINTEGEGESNVFQLQIKRAPYCQKEQKWSYGVARNEAARISCQVDAFPRQVTFYWTFNNTVGVLRNLTPSTSELTQSTLLFIPRSETDFGTFYCWASNEMGIQLSPCVFTMVTAEIPDPVNNCTVYNQTQTSFYIECHAGYNGGLVQEFMLEIFDVTNKKMRSELKSPRPLFYVTGLQPGIMFQLGVFAANSKGRSEVMEVVTETLKEFKDEEESLMFSTIINLGVLSGTVGVLLLLSVAIVCTMKCRVGKKKRRRNYQEEEVDRCKSADDEKCPDVIPSTNGKEVIFHTEQEFPLVDIKCLRKHHEMTDEHCVQQQQPGILGNLLNHITWESTCKVRPCTKEDIVSLQHVNVDQRTCKSDDHYYLSS